MARPALRSSTAAPEREALWLAESLGWLAAEADLLERLLSHIGEERDKARAARERLERRRASMDEADRAPSEAGMQAEAAAIESRLTRLRVAALLAMAFARLRSAEAEALGGQATQATEERRLGRAS